MDSSRKYLKVASIISFIIGVISLPTVIYSTFLFVFGFIFFLSSLSSDDKLSEQRKILQVMGIINIPLNKFWKGK